MKKWLLLLVASLVLMLAACGGDGDKKQEANQNNSDETSEETKNEESTSEIIAGAPLQDGTYSLSEKDFDDHGWKAQMEITVKDGKIVESKFDYVNADGQFKSEDEDYQKSMSEKNGIGPADFIPQLNKALVETQDAKSIDVVTGATHSWGTFINYAQQLIQAAQKGDTTPIVVDAAASLKDGEYQLTEKNLDANGWKVTMKMTVEGGKITAFDYNYVDKDGNLKSENEDYEKMMKEKSGVGPKEFIPALSESLLKTQSAYDVEVVSGATHSSYAFKAYAAQLINAAQKGDTTPIEVDNIVVKNH
jgi:FMN-binding domain.